MNKDKHLINSKGAIAKNPKNKTWEEYSSQAQTVAQKTALSKFKDLPFSKEWALPYKFSSIIKVICGIVSGLGLSLCFYFALNVRFNYLLSLLISLLLCALLEVLKMFSWDKLSKFVLKYKNYPFALVSLAVTLNFISVGGSALGSYFATQRATNTINSNSPVALENVDSIGLTTEKKVESINLSISSYMSEIKSTKSNSTKRSLNNSVEQLLEERKQVVESGRVAVKQARERNSKTLKDHAHSYERSIAESKETANRYSLLAVLSTLLFELLLIVSTCFNSYYLFRLYVDSGQHEEESVSHAPNEAETTNPTQDTKRAQSVPAPSLQAQEKEVRRIGFSQTQNVERDPLHKTPNVNGVRSKECLHCNKSMEYANDSKIYCSAKCRGAAYRLRKKLEE